MVLLWTELRKLECLLLFYMMPLFYRYISQKYRILFGIVQHHVIKSMRRQTKKRTFL